MSKNESNIDYTKILKHIDNSIPFENNDDIYFVKEIFRENGFDNNEIQDYIANFVSELKTKYYNNPYHSWFHALDVFNNINYLMCIILNKNKKEDKIKIFALLVSALIHDAGHIGRTNNYILRTGHDYFRKKEFINCNSVQEKESLIIFENIINNKECNCNILNVYTTNIEKQKQIKDLIKIYVLDTDMKIQFNKKKSCDIDDYVIDDNEECNIISALLHIADLGHFFKEKEEHIKWVMRVMKEFFIETEELKKLNLPTLPFMDQNNVIIPSEQVYFIEQNIIPNLKKLEPFIKKSYCGDISYNRINKLLNNNLNYWKNFNKLPINEQNKINNFL